MTTPKYVKTVSKVQTDILKSIMKDSNADIRYIKRDHEVAYLVDNVMCFVIPEIWNVLDINRFKCIKDDLIAGQEKISDTEYRFEKFIPIEKGMLSVFKSDSDERIYFNKKYSDLFDEDARVYSKGPKSPAIFKNYNNSFIEGMLCPVNHTES